MSKKNPEYITAAYYFGNFHVDPRNEASHGKGWTEWNLVRTALPRFPGHKQPKTPLWGHGDDSQPSVFAQKIATAARASLSAFIFDWYWYDDGPFLQRALEDGYLCAPNSSDVRFALMWANHDWYDIHPAKLGSSPPHLQFPGEVTPETFDAMTTYIVDRYFSRPEYLLLDGRPYFSIYELHRFVRGMGGTDAAAEKLREFREKVKGRGFPDLHLNAVTWGVQLLPGEGETVPDLKTLLERLGVDSTTSYVWIHHVPLRDFPVTRYEVLGAAYEAYRGTAEGEMGRVYFPNVSVGWDSTPRACQSDVFTDAAYPFIPVVEGNSPERFGEALRSAKGYLDGKGKEGDGAIKMVTINSWNEWTEGSYLEPDTENGLGYLDQIREVFGKKEIKEEKGVVGAARRWWRGGG